jgi:hypothetical protein
MTPWSPETYDAYDGWPVRSWCCGRNRWLDGVMEKARSTQARTAGTVRRLADPKEKSRAVSELAREVGLTEEKVTSVIEKLGLTEIKRFKDDTGDDSLEAFRWGHSIIIF